jgi:hypothetical protein
VHLWRGRETEEQNENVSFKNCLNFNSLYLKQLPPLSFNVEFENLVFQREEPSTSKKPTQIDQQSTSNETDYLSLNETETLP